MYYDYEWEEHLQKNPDCFESPYLCSCNDEFPSYQSRVSHITGKRKDKFTHYAVEEEATAKSNMAASLKKFWCSCGRSYSTEDFRSVHMKEAPQQTEHVAIDQKDTRSFLRKRSLQRFVRDEGLMDDGNPGPTETFGHLAECTALKAFRDANNIEGCFDLLSPGDQLKLVYEFRKVMLRKGECVDDAADEEDEFQMELEDLVASRGY